MECKWHPLQTTDLVCLKCGQEFCRECVVETRESHYCPDCHQAEVERIASQFGAKPAAPKVKKEKQAREPKAPAEAPEGEPRARRERKLRKPAERPAESLAVPGLDEVPPAPVPEPPPPPSITPEEKAAFWGDIEEPRKAKRRVREPERTGGLPPPLAVEGMPPAPSVPVASTGGGPEIVPESRKKRLVPEEVREKAVMTAEGFPTGEAPAETAEVPGRERAPRRERSSRKAPGSGVVAMQVPDDYDGETTTAPRYLRAVLVALGSSILLAGAYAGFEWWRHSGRWIFGWFIGFIIGVVVVLASGRHFNWKLGLIATGFAWFSLCLGQLTFSILDVRFNEILPFKLGFFSLLDNGVRTLGSSFLTLWVVLFVLTGAVAFLVSFRPWPVRLQLQGPAEPRKVARRGA
ncbi:MAG: hypothetical protein KKF41_12580 [Actinobacteria bacterium]|nr:hypothetical protein [Actinomycetota bacterium]MBU1944730.1 hypothetical protein [Actinomycetota bacterium]MBU2688411.1 hypothetical protein [Actinomycetota bacterium]